MPWDDALRPQPAAPKGSETLPTEPSILLEYGKMGTDGMTDRPPFGFLERKPHIFPSIDPVA